MGKRKTRRIPQRTCVGCREVGSKLSLIRVVRTPEGVKIDPTGKMNGRGAYLHNNPDCWNRGLQGPLAHALNTEIKQTEIEQFEIYINAMTEK